MTMKNCFDTDLMGVEKMDIIMRLHDKSKVDELKKYGVVVYDSQYTNVVGVSCTEENYKIIMKLSNVYDCQEAATGNLLSNQKKYYFGIDWASGNDKTVFH